MRKIALIAIAAAFVHAALAVGLLSIAGGGPGYSRDGVPSDSLHWLCGQVSGLLLLPLRWLPSDVYEPRTSLLFAANSLLWGLAIAIFWQKGCDTSSSRAVGER